MNPDAQTIGLLTDLRHQLHQHPEISGKEKNTASTLIRFINGCPGWEIHENIGGHGFLAIYQAPAPGKNLLFRAELDGLPQHDHGQHDWHSQIPGAAHACGHDGHMTILAGLAGAISKNPPARGKVMLLFQPGEENGTGAAACLSHPVFGEFRPDFVFALHNLPGYPLGQVVIREGIFSASVKSMIIRLQGKVSHAAEPELGINPSFYAADLLGFCKDHQQTDPANRDFFLITPTFVRIGEPGHGSAAGDAEICLTFRAWEDRIMENNLQFLMMQMAGLGKQHKIRASVKFTDIFPATRNNASALAILKASAKKNQLEVTTAADPFRWGEDFGAFTGRYPGALFGLGSGEQCPSLHNTVYDFPDELIPVAIGLFRGIID